MDATETYLNGRKKRAESDATLTVIQSIVSHAAADRGKRKEINSRLEISAGGREVNEEEKIIDGRQKIRGCVDSAALCRRVRVPRSLRERGNAGLGKKSESEVGGIL